MTQEPLGCLACEEVRVKCEVYLLCNFQFDRQAEVKLGGPRIDFKRLPFQSPKLDISDRGIHHVEQHLDQRGHARISADLKRIDQSVERVILVRKSAERSFLYPFH